MHTDRKIGFAMGILLIGIVAALFFRNEPLLETEVSGVRRERELNERLRERDVAVYLSDSKEEVVDEGSDDPPWTLRDVLRDMNERNKSAPSAVGSSKAAARYELDGRPQPSLDGYRRARDTMEHEDIEDGGRSRAPVRIPESLQAGESPRVNAEPPALPRELPPLFPQSEPEPATATSEKAGDSLRDFEPPEEFDEYTVKFGDTLSGIAQKTLGSPNRYREIYEANRDRMASPDRLDIGKSLRIPRIAGNPANTY